MNKKNLCIFDLDGTLYNKNSSITLELREKVILLISEKQLCDLEQAKKIYQQLPLTFANPYHGLASVGISGEEYKKIFNSIQVEKFIKKDNKLIGLFKELSSVSIIQVLSFAPINYINKMLKQIGIFDEVSLVCSVEEAGNFLKKEHYLSVKKEQNKYSNIYVIGDDYINDLNSAIESGFKTKLVNFDNINDDIYSVIASICSELKEYSVPSVIRMEISSHCNERCIICPYLQRKEHGKMDKVLFEEIISQHVAITKKPKIIFPSTIGEPFLNKDFLMFVKIASRYYSNISTFSNATQLSEEMVQKYIDCGGTELMLTLHGFYKEDFETITRTKFYERVKENIMICAKVNAKNKYPLVIYLDIYSSCENLENNSYVKELKKLGVIVNLLDIKQIHNWGGKIGMSSRRKRECKRITKQFGVRFDGSIIPCCADINGENILGDAKKKPIKDIFNSKEYIMMYSLSKANLLNEIPLCKYCNI